MTKVLIEREAYQKICAYTDLCPAEISGLGRVQFVDGNAIVKDVAIFDQQVSGAHSDIDPKSLAKFQDERVKAGESMSEWCLWWHSHANMNVFFSGTDTSTIDSSTEFKHLLSIVVNKKRDIRARMDIYQPVRMFLDNLDVDIIDEGSPDIMQACKSEIEAKVKLPAERKSPSVSRPYQGQPDFNGRDDERMGLLDVPKRDDKQDRAGFRTHVKENGYNSDLATDEMIIEEYFDQKRYLLKQIRKAEAKKKEVRVQKLREEYTQLVLWGRSTGIEVRELAGSNNE